MRILGLDYGTKKVGVAISDKENFIATPFCTVETVELLKTLDEFIIKYGIEKIVVGVPYSSCQISCTEQLILNFIAILRKKYQDRIEVATISERYTSKIAKQSLINFNFSKKTRKTKGIVDMMSAAILLQDYLDKQKKIFSFS